MNPGEASLRRRVTTLTLALAVLIGGVLAFDGLSRLEDPEFTIKHAQVITRYPGATAQEVAEEVTDEIEIAVQQLGQLRWVTSNSRPGLSIVTVTIQDEYDREGLPQVWDELRRKVGDVQGRLPPGAGPSIVNDGFGDVFGIFLAVYGDGFSYAALKDHVDMLQKELLLVEDVAQVSVFGAQQEAIFIEIARERLARLGISEWQVYATLRGRNYVTPSGQVEIGPSHVRIGPGAGLSSVDAIRHTPIQGLVSGRQIYIGDVAEVRREYQDPPTRLLRFDGRPAIGLGISTAEGGNVVNLGEAVKRRLDELQAETPLGLEVGVIYWQSRYVIAAIRAFLVNLAQAIAIVIGVLLLTMGLRSGLIIGGILLITVIATFLPMKSSGVALERISLGALIIALGMLVDNAIVVTEGIQIRIERGMDRLLAAREVVGSTMWPLLGGTLVAILAFGALGFSQDATGEFTRSLFHVITYSLLLSWVFGITLTPLLCALFLRGRDPKAPPKDPYGGAVFRMYRNLLDHCLRNRWATVLAMALLLGVSVRAFGLVEQSFFPDSTTPQFTVDYWTTQGTHVRNTETDLGKLEEYILGSERVGGHRGYRGLEGVRDVATVLGGGALRFMLTYAPEEPNPSYGQLLVEVQDVDRIEALVPEIERFVAAEFPDALVYARRFVLGPGGGSEVEARLGGPDPEVLRGLSEQAKQIMRMDAQARDVRDDWRQPVLVVEPILRLASAARLGLTRQDISRATQRTFGGLTIDLFREGEDLIPIVAQAPEAERAVVDGLFDMQVWSDVARRTVPLEQIVSGFDTGFQDSIVARRNRMPTITPQCNAAFGHASTLQQRLMPKIEAIDLPPGYSLEWGGEYENSRLAKRGLARMFPLMIVLMVLIVVLQFDSLKVPGIIFLTVPLAIIGVTGGLLLSGHPFGFMALLGALSLIGMLVKNGIVLADEMNTQIATGKPRYGAVLDAAVSRLRPVSMAALTTLLGMTPLLLDAFFASMAVTIMGGLAFATVLTMIVVPTLYVIFFRIRPDES